MLPENIPVWNLWLLVQTQWRVGGIVLIGLDYAAVFRVAELHGLQMTPQVFEGLQCLEYDTLEEQRDKMESQR